MLRRPPRSTRTDTLFPYTTLFRSETGVVRVVEDRCTGCGECVVACPYGAMGYDPVDHHAVKCDLCTDRRAAGGTPACASVCPGHALSFGERKDHVERARAEGRTMRDHDHFLMGQIGRAHV